MYISFRVKYPLFFVSDFNQTSIFWTSFRKSTQVSISLKKSSSESRDVPCGRTDRHMTKLVFAFRNFANAP